MNQEIETLEKYLLIEQERYNRKFTFDFLISSDLEESEPEIAPSMVQPFLENAIMHGFYKKSADNPGHLVIRFEPLNKAFIRCIIEDNGEGMIASGKRNNLDRKDHVSQGIQIIKDRLALYSERFRSTQEIVAEELFPGQSEPGTKVIVPIPLKRT